MKLILGIYSDRYFQSSPPIIPERKIEDLKKNGVKSILCILSREEHKSLYETFYKSYEEKGFNVDCVYIDSLSSKDLPVVKESVVRLSSQIKENSCLILSFDKKDLAAIIGACLLILIKKVPEDAIRLIKTSININIETKDALSFIYGFKKYLENEYIIPEESLDIDLTEALDQETSENEIEDTLEQREEETIKPAAEEPFEDFSESEQEELLKRDEAEIESKKNISFPLRWIKPLRLNHFKPTIRFKLISIISLVIIIALSAMIFLATFFFRSDNELRIEESNHRIAGIIALNVRNNFASIIEKSNLLATTMFQQFKTDDQGKLFTDLFFTNERSFIFLGIATRSGNTIRLKKSIYNRPFMIENGIIDDNIETINRSNSNIALKAFHGEVVVFNVSPYFKIPVMGITLPFEKDKSKKTTSILITYIKLDRFIHAFKSSGITKTFMINDQGDVILHPDSNVVLSHSNYINLPIVKMMMKSKLDNGHRRYEDKNGIAYLGSFKKIGFGGTGIIATVKEDKAFEEVYNIQRRNIYITIIVLSIAVFIVYFFGKTLTMPIIKLLGATHEIEEGNFNVAIQPSTRDEIGDLTRSFIAMGRGLEEREKMKDAFGKFVNKEIAEQVLKGEIHLGGERKNAAIFFSDIRSFTDISEKLEPEEVVEFLNQYMTRMVNCVNNTNGVVDKYIGDAIMAIWGAPISKGNDTENAINAALLMRKELIEFNKGRGGDKKPIIKIGCGINWGPVLAGQIGSEDRMEYTVIGDVVNLASRIEALNKPFGTDILISQDAYNMVKDLFVVEKMQEIKVKGKETPQQIYAVIGKPDDTSMPRTIEELRGLLGTEEQPSIQRIINLDEDEVKYEILE